MLTFGRGETIPYCPLFIAVGLHFGGTTMAEDKFTGFPREMFSFLKDLAKNNDKAWFERHREDYEQYFIAPAKAFVSALDGELRPRIPNLVAEPKVNGSVRRINRDVRFSKDKSPYHTHLQVMVWEGLTPRMGGSGLSIWLEPGKFFVGAGIHVFPKPALEAFRSAVDDAERGKDLAGIAARIEKAGYPLGGRHYKRIPSGFEPGHPRVSLLLHNGLTAGQSFPVPDSVHTPRFLKEVTGHFKTLLPLHAWLVRLLEGG